MEKTPNQKRYFLVLKEKTDLDFKREKLNDFITNNENFKKLSIEQQNLLKNQASAMNLYSLILDLRLKQMEKEGYLDEM